MNRRFSVLVCALLSVAFSDHSMVFGQANPGLITTTAELVDGAEGLFTLNPKNGDLRGMLPRARDLTSLHAVLKGNVVKEFGKGANIRYAMASSRWAPAQRNPVILWVCDLASGKLAAYSFAFSKLDFRANRPAGIINIGLVTLLKAPCGADVTMRVAPITDDQSGVVLFSRKTRTLKLIALGNKGEIIGEITSDLTKDLKDAGIASADCSLVANQSLSTQAQRNQVGKSLISIVGKKMILQYGVLWNRIIAKQGRKQTGKFVPLRRMSLSK